MATTACKHRPRDVTDKESNKNTRRRIRPHTILNGFIQSHIEQINQHEIRQGSNGILSILVLHHKPFHFLLFIEPAMGLFSQNIEPL